MIGADANVVLRFLLDDDPVHAPLARQFFEQRTPGDPAFISLVVLLEVVWVLRRGHRRSEDEIARIVRTLLGSSVVVVQHAELVIRALRDAAGSRVGLSDALIAHLGVDAGADGTVTFDRRAAELPGMLAL